MTPEAGAGDDLLPAQLGVGVAIAARQARGAARGVIGWRRNARRLRPQGDLFASTTSIRGGALAHSHFTFLADSERATRWCSRCAPEPGARAGTGFRRARVDAFSSDSIPVH